MHNLSRIVAMLLYPCHVEDRCFLLRCVRFVASSRPVIRYAKKVFRHYPLFRHRSATPAGVTGNGGARNPGDNVTSILGSAVEREPTRRPPASRRSGASSPGHVNPGEVLIMQSIVSGVPRGLSWSPGLLRGTPDTILCVIFGRRRADRGMLIHLSHS